MLGPPKTLELEAHAHTAMVFVGRERLVLRSDRVVVIVQLQVQTANVVEAPHNARLGHPVAAGHHILHVSHPDERLQRLAMRVPSSVSQNVCLVRKGDGWVVYKERPARRSDHV